MKMDYTPKSWEERNAERLRHAFGIHDLVRDRGAFSVAPDKEFNWARQAEGLQSRINRFRSMSANQRAINRNSAVASSPVFSGNNTGADIITHNIKGGKRNFRGVRRDLLSLLADDPGIIGLQETGNKKRTKRIFNFFRNQGYGIRGKSNTPIAFDKDQYRLKDFGAPVISRATYVGPQGAGPSTLKQKYANYLILKQLGGGPLRSVTNVHLAPSRQLAVRRRLSDQQIANVAALQREIARRYKGVERAVIGDLNVGKVGPLAPLARAGLNIQQSPFDTHRVGTPDWLIGDGITNLRTRNTGSDHDALLGNFRNGPSRANGGQGDFGALVRAIAGKESGGNYSAVNPHSGALGKYQIMPGNIASWSREALGYSITPQQFLANPRLQEQIAQHRLRKYYSQYGAAGAASAWYSGDPNKWRTSRNPQGQYPSIYNYVQAILRSMGN